MSAPQPPVAAAPEPAHTPSPWFAEIIEPGRRALIRGIDSIAGMRNSGDFLPDEFDANARMIAAAPEMLEALRDADAVFRLLPKLRNCAQHRRVMAAIRKAEGLA